MELIKISDLKIKIMLNASDMNRLELNGKDLDPEDLRMHRAFRKLMAEIRKQTGFEAEDSRLSVQFFPSREGGGEMFVSSLPRDTEETALHIPPAKSPCPLGKVEKKPISCAFRKEGSLCFPSFEVLLQACRRLLAIGYIGDSSVFVDDHRVFHLLLVTLSPSPVLFPKELCFLAEYGTFENYEKIGLYLSEHGKKICSPDAVSRLAPLAP